MVQQAAVLARRIRCACGRGAFLGEYLSAPKPQIVFSRRAAPRSPRGSPRLCRARGLRLDLRTRDLFREREFFVNGERVEPPGRCKDPRASRRRARSCRGRALRCRSFGCLHDWYLAAGSHRKRHE